jgi:hypothetical protein
MVEGINAHRKENRSRRGRKRNGVQKGVHTMQMKCGKYMADWCDASGTRKRKAFTASPFSKARSTAR